MFHAKNSLCQNNSLQKCHWKFLLWKMSFMQKFLFVKSDSACKSDPMCKRVAVQKWRRAKMSSCKNDACEKVLLVQKWPFVIKMVIPKWILFRINNSKPKLPSKVEKKFLNSPTLKTKRNYKYLESAILNYSSKFNTLLFQKDFNEFSIYVKEVVIITKE